MTTKRKVSLTLSEDLVRLIDRDVATRPGATRSSVVESWLRSASRRYAERALETATVAYYQSLTAEDHAEDEAIARAFSGGARRLEIDAPLRRSRKS